MRVLLTIIEACIKLNEKILIFSQFTETLDMMEQIFQKVQFHVNVVDDIVSYDKKLKKNVDYYRIDGATPTGKRDEYIHKYLYIYIHVIVRFNTDDNATLFLLSLRAGGLGINLQTATRVCLYDVPWDPSFANQAIFRTYRYGQTRPVTIYRFVSFGTVEHSIWKVQNILYNNTCIIAMHEQNMDL